jgi:hypothetical protein
MLGIFKKIIRWWKFFTFVHWSQHGASGRAGSVAHDRTVPFYHPLGRADFPRDRAWSDDRTIIAATGRAEF